MVTHIPVLVKEVVEVLNVHPTGRFIDCTVGSGGHAAAIVEQCLPSRGLLTTDAVFLGIDTDPEAIAAARVRLKPYGNAVCLVNDNFANLRAIYDKFNTESSPHGANGILFDLGLSYLPLADSDRTFSFQHDGPLDTLFGPDQKLTVAEIVNTYSEFRIAQIIWFYGQETHSRRIARQIIESRPLKTTYQLAQAVEKALGGERGRIHPAAKTFQALSIAVSQELTDLESALKQAVALLGVDALLAVITYHPLEDRFVKQFLQRETTDCFCPPESPICACGHKAMLSLYNKEPIKPGAEEIAANPRSRSAKLRVAKRFRETGLRLSTYR